MDHDRFDIVARRVFSDLKQSRRAAVATLLATTLLRHTPGAALAKPKARAQATTAETCYPRGKTCSPGKGKITSGCNFAFSTVFRNRDVRGANLSHNNFYNADLTGADFRGANLGDGCFINANLTGAKLGSSVNLRGAVFCRTTMPDGTIDNSGCDGDTPCCHRLVQDCPDQKIFCFTSDEHQSQCIDFQGAIGPKGMCWSFGFGCCPCENETQEYWSDQCNKTFSGCGGTCVAGNEIPFECLSFRNCSTGPEGRA
jgi:hypothetical protein